MSLIFSPLMLISSRMTSTVFQMMQRRKNLNRKINVYWLLLCFCYYLLHLGLCIVLLLCLAWCDVERGPWWSQGLGKQVHPHHQTSLMDNIKIVRTKQEIHWQQNNLSWKFLKDKWDMNRRKDHYLLYVRLQRAVQWPGLHMFGYQSNFPQDVKG